MSQTGINFTESLNAWSDITMKVLLQRMDVLGFGDEAEHLRKSLLSGRLRISSQGSDQYKMDLEFNLYGRYVDMGVGRGVSKKFESDNPREPKEWLSRYWWAQLQRLKEIMQEKYTKATVDTIIDSIYGGTGNYKTTKGFMYADKQAIRNARNYTRRRALPGRWTSNHKTWKPDQWKK